VEYTAGGSLDLPGVLRALRRRADLSQRQLAARSGVPPATVAGVESGASPNPSLRTVQRLVTATGARLAIVDTDGSEPTRLATDQWRDGAQRLFPPHLDVQRVAWRGARRVNGFGFIRNRRLRDLARRHSELREEVTFEVRRLEPGDAAALEAIRRSNRDLDPAGRPASREEPLSEHEALRYLRDPSLRHWIAQERLLFDPRVLGRVLGHLAVRIHQPLAGPSTMVVTEFGLRPDSHDDLAGVMLVAAMSEEAARLEVREVIALSDHQAAARLLARHGFISRPKRPPVLTLAW
jgi:transcriptional regulator with XRE-family HTH domain